MTFTIYAGSNIGSAADTALTVTIDGNVGTNTSAANNTNIVTLNQFGVFALQVSQATVSTPFFGTLFILAPFLLSLLALKYPSMMIVVYGTDANEDFFSKIIIHLF